MKARIYFVMFLTVAVLQIELVKVCYEGKQSPSLANEKLCWQQIEISSCPVVQCFLVWKEADKKTLYNSNDELTIDQFSNLFFYHFLKNSTLFMMRQINKEILNHLSSFKFFNHFDSLLDQSLNQVRKRFEWEIKLQKRSSNMKIH